MYKITAIIEKSGNAPTSWTRYSKVKMTQPQCEKMISGRHEAGVSRIEKATLKRFKCVKVTPGEL
ncbi:DUF1187 family protein [Salmonella enterica]|nr:DUF1187 family protein [Salmonella enterica subsp. enterica serovar Typhimurium]EEP9290042.1 DUF1187 family protein [Salmonella enterica]EGX8325154.1 DUF1187 family protein [Salmonella enterica subsp. enterica serovar Javiana]HCM1957527.1 DUF1187 family protein [Salmonella enterica subsp. houtenae serovar Houten]EJA5032661.1 DUF1187 family protein [Salmonella enterica]